MHRCGHGALCVWMSASDGADDEMGNVILRSLTTVTTPHANKRFRKFMAFLYYRRCCWRRRLRAAKTPNVFVDTNLLTKSLTENSNIAGFYSHRMIRSYRPPSVTLTLRVSSYDSPLSPSAMNYLYMDLHLFFTRFWRVCICTTVLVERINWIAIGMGNLMCVFASHQHHHHHRWAWAMAQCAYSIAHSSQ